MNELECSCARFARLEGASATAYAKTFLEELPADAVGTAGERAYRCRECGRAWERQAPATKTEGTRASLVRLDV